MRTVFIRKDNEAFFDAIEKKSEFINALLAKEQIGSRTSHESIGRLQDEIQRREVIKQIPEPKRNTAGFCKNGHPIPEGRDRCLGKGCKYS